MFVKAVDEHIDKAIQINDAWKKLLNDAIVAGSARITSGQACDAKLCAMSQWLASPLFGAQLRESKEYRRVYRLHHEFHRSAGNILSYIERGKASAAHFLLEGDFMERSDELVAALVRLRNARVQFHEFTNIAREPGRLLGDGSQNP